MPRYQVEIGGKRYEIEAPTPEAAQNAVQQMQSQGQPQQPAAPAAAQPPAPGIGASVGAMVGGMKPPRLRPIDALRQQVEQAGGAQRWIEGAFQRGAVGLDSAVRSTASGVPILGALADRADPRPEQDAEFARNFPVLSNVLPIAGGMAATGLAAGTGIGKALFGVTGANPLARVAAGGTTGAAIGGVDAGIRSDWNPLQTMIGAGIGGLTGGAIPAIGNKIGKWFGDRPTPRATGPTVQQMEESAQALYRTAREAGLTVRPESFSLFTGDLARAAKDAGFNARMHPKIAIALDEASDMMGKVSAPSLSELDMLRRLINDAGMDSPDQGRLAGVMADKLDDWLTRLQPWEVATGDPAVGVGAITKARELWSRMKKAEQVEGIFERARNAVSANYTSAGMTTALRQQFRQMADSWTRNPRLRNMWSKDEQDAILRVVRGAPLENVMRYLGKFAPRGLLSTAISGGAGFQVAGVPGAAAVLTAGEIGQWASNALSRRAADRVDLLVRSGQRSIAPPPRVSRPVDEATTHFLQSVAMPSVPLLAPRLSPTK